MAELAMLKAIVAMARPFILLAGVLAYITGLSMAFYESGTIDLSAAVFGLIVLLTATMMGHYADEYADQDTDGLTRRTRFSGGSGVLASGAVRPITALNMAVLMLLLTMALASVGHSYHIFSETYIWLLAASLVLGWFYSMRPVQLERRSLGEIANAFLGGTCMVLSGYLPQVKELSILSILLCIPLTLAVLVNLIGVHWADREADKMVGKMTMVVRLGTSSIALFAVLMVMTYVSFFMIWADRPDPLIPALMASTVPYAVYAFVRFKNRGEPWPGSIFMALAMTALTLGFIFS
ncbi:MAG TPA: prenyltransferase [Methanomassiliicoccales archaeon]|nr:prenyltransferase [Methanomassiliicoccales archaeon]